MPAPNSTSNANMHRRMIPSFGGARPRGVATATSTSAGVSSSSSAARSSGFSGGKGKGKGIVRRSVGGGGVGVRGERIEGSGGKFAGGGVWGLGTGRGGLKRHRYVF